MSHDVCVKKVMVKGSFRCALFDTVFQSDVSPAGTGCRPHLMEDILSNAKSTAFPGCHGNDESQMSAEAVRVVADMPDIRFMLSRVLMFPVRQ